MQKFLILFLLILSEINNFNLIYKIKNVKILRELFFYN